MKASRLRGMPVVSVASAEKVGEVHDLVLNPDAQRVVAIRIKLVPAGIVKSVSALDVTVGRDAVTIKDSRSIPEEELTEVEGTVDLSKLLGKKALSHGGNVLGTVGDVLIDTADLKITDYELSGGPIAGLFGGGKTLPAGEGFHYGRDILMVPDGVSVREGKKAA